MQSNYLNKASVYIKTTSYIENKDKNLSKNELEILEAKFYKYVEYILVHANGRANELLAKAYNERVAILFRINQLYQVSQVKEVFQVNQVPKKDPALQQACSHRGFIEINFFSLVTTAKKREEYHHLLIEIGQIHTARKIYLLRPSSIIDSL